MLTLGSDAVCSWGSISIFGRIVDKIPLLQVVKSHTHSKPASWLVSLLRVAGSSCFKTIDLYRMERQQRLEQLQ
jgi:hypothetical protein